MQLGPQLPSPAPRRGAVVIFFALMLVVVMALFALSLDLGYLCAVKADLQSAVDAGALAGSGAIIDGSSKALGAARQFTELNLNNSGVKVSNGQETVSVEIGRWNQTQRTFEQGGSPLDAVRVTAQLDNASLFFGRLIGSQHFSSEATAIAAYRPRDIMLVLDVSGSMSEARNGVAKIDELASSVERFINYLQLSDANDRVGFTYYSTTASLGSPLSFELDQVESQIMSRLTPGGYTNIADGMQLAISELQTQLRDYALPLLVVLTDGAANMNQPGNWVDTTEAKARVVQRAYQAQAANIRAVTIALDSQTSAVDVALMEQVANITDGEAYHVLAGEPANPSSTQLEDIFYRTAADRPLRIVD
ncbi:MAG: VWA domain-containing protein [Pirellulaceae bacterium]